MYLLEVWREALQKLGAGIGPQKKEDSGSTWWSDNRVERHPGTLRSTRSLPWQTDVEDWRGNESELCIKGGNGYLASSTRRWDGGASQLNLITSSLIHYTIR